MVAKTFSASLTQWSGVKLSIDVMHRALKLLIEPSVIWNGLVTCNDTR